MQKSRPLGVTILALWALVGGGVVFTSAILFILWMQAYYQDDLSGFFGIIGDFIVVPLGRPVLGGLVDPTWEPFAFANITTKLSSGILYVLVGAFTLKGNKLAWLGNVVISIAGILSAVLLHALLFNMHIQYADDSLWASSGYIQFLAVTITIYSIFLALASVRLYYLFRPSVRDFFGIKSLPIQRRAT